jgi:hypothetical protein
MSTQFIIQDLFRAIRHKHRWVTLAQPRTEGANLMDTSRRVWGTMYCTPLLNSQGWHFYVMNMKKGKSNEGCTSLVCCVIRIRSSDLLLWTCLSSKQNDDTQHDLTQKQRLSRCMRTLGYSCVCNELLTNVLTDITWNEAVCYKQGKIKPRNN